MMLQAIRFRFLLFAGILPYLLGSVIGHWYLKSLGQAGIVPEPPTFHFQFFFLGLIGIVFALFAVQILNENFDIALGSEEVFTSARPPPLLPLKAGVIASLIALTIGLYLAMMRGWPLLIFLAFGAFAALFYLGPPLRLAYRGLGELMIFLAYGPFMTLGAYYLQTGAIAASPFLISMAIGFLVLALTIINEIPDYHADKLVGKRNLVMRYGREKATILHAFALFAGFAIFSVGACLGVIPIFSLSAFVALPLACWSISVGHKNYNHPENLKPAIKGTAFVYVMVTCTLILSYQIN
jgi:1,4-dihydroxy-2-naphthoate octaprenyltransferase